MAFDARSGRAMLFGGLCTKFFPPYADDLWQFDGRSWFEWQGSGPRPTRRYYAAACHDSVRNRLVVFGGFYAWGNSTTYDETWEFDGSSWRLHGGSVKPAKRVTPGLAFDEPRGVVVMFGGSDIAQNPSVMFADTWAYDGTQWTQKQPRTSPPARTVPGMAYDKKRRRVVLFGGAGHGGAMNDTWEWDGTDWSRMSPVQPGPFRAYANLVYDESRECMVMYGGFVGSTTLGETWEYDGSTWRMRAPVGNPPPLQGHAVAYDSWRRQTILFGGWDGIVNGIYEDTWVYAPVAGGSFSAYSQACRGSAANDPVLKQGAGDPYIASPFAIQLHSVLPTTYALLVLGTSKTIWNGLPLPLDLGWFGMPGCKLAASYDWSVSGWSDANGVMVWSFGIPQDPGLIGARFYNQAFALDPAANPRRLVLSNACEGVIGSK